MKRRSWAILIALSFLAGLVTWWLVEYEPVHEGWCKLRVIKPKSLFNSTVLTLAAQLVKPLPSAPNDITGLPESFKTPFFFSVRAGTRTLTLVADVSGEPVLCLDTDGDRDFADEQIYSVKSRNEGGHKLDLFGPIRIPSGKDNSQAETLIHASVVVLPNGKVAHVWLCPATYRRGRARLGPRVYDVALADGDFDGEVSSVVSLPIDNLANLPHSDVLAIDYDRNGQWTTPSEITPLGRMIRFGHTYFGVNVSADGKRLDLKKIEPEQGKLSLDAGGGRPELRLWSDAAQQHLLDSGHDWDLPKGTYQATSVVLKLKDSKDNEWVFFPKQEMSKLLSFEVAKGKTTHIEMGPHFVVTADIERRDSGDVSINAILRGRAGEEYGLDFRRNGKRVREPKIKIMGEDGTLLQYDTFKYG